MGIKKPTPRNPIALAGRRLQGAAPKTLLGRGLGIANSNQSQNKIWLIKAVDRATGRTVAWVLGGRDAATFQRLYDKVKHLKNYVF
jgi:hypothetical protein